jgi:hypothetical protein
MTTAIAHDDITMFLKYLVELGDIYSVDTYKQVCIKETGDVQRINTAPDEADPPADAWKPLVIYHDMRKPGDYLLLNPLREKQSGDKASIWFWTATSNVLQHFVVEIIRHIVQVAQEEQVSPDVLNLIPAGHVVDLKMLEHINTICEKKGLSAFIQIFYSAKERIGQIVCDVTDPEFQKEFGKTIPQKTWKFLTDLLHRLLQTDDDIKKVYSFKSTVSSGHKSQVYLTLLFRAYECLAPVIKSIWGMDINIEEFRSHLPHLEKYQQMVQWDDGQAIASSGPIRKPWGINTVSNKSATKTPPGTVPYASSGSPIPYGSPYGNVPVYQPPQYSVAPPTVAHPYGAQYGTPYGAPQYGAPSYGYPPQYGQAQYPHYPNPYGAPSVAQPAGMYGTVPYGQVPSLSM